MTTPQEHALIAPPLHPRERKIASELGLTALLERQENLQAYLESARDSRLQLEEEFTGRILENPALEEPIADQIARLDVSIRLVEEVLRKIPGMLHVAERELTSKARRSAHRLTGRPSRSAKSEKRP